MNNRHLKKWLTKQLSIVLIFANILFTGTQVSFAEIQTDTLMVNEHLSDEGIIDTVDVVGENKDETVVKDIDTLSEDAVGRLALMASSDDIASGTDLDIAWVIDANGKLTVEGTGDFSSCTQSDRAPWYSNRHDITSAEVKVTGMTNASYMFYGCVWLHSLDLSNFDTRNITNMRGMFEKCGLTNLDLSNFDTSNVTDMSWMFFDSSFTSLDLSNFDTSNVTDMSRMFAKCNNLTSLNLSNFNTINVTDMLNMFNMFYECRNLTTLDLSSFNTRNATDMHGMFENCYNLSSLNLCNFDTSNVTDMSRMFANCHSLTTLDLSNFDTSNVTDMSRMFEKCYYLTNLNLCNFDTSNVTDMQSMFAECCYLTSLDLSNFDTSNVTDMQSMFEDCYHLTSLNLDNFDTCNVTKMQYMFSSSFSSLTSLDLSSFNLKNIENNRYMFGLATLKNLTTLYTPYNLSHSISLPTNSGDIWYRSDGSIVTEYRSDGSIVTELPQNLNYSVALGRNYIPGKNVSPNATFYFTDDTKYYVYSDETFAYFSGTFKAVQKGNVNEEADAIVWKSSDPLVADINHMLYVPDTGNIYSDDNAYSSAMFYLYMDCYKPGTTTVTGTSADGRTISGTMTVEPKLIAGETVSITGSSDVMLCKIELTEKTDEQLEFVQNFIKSLDVNIIKGAKMDLKPIYLSDDDFIELHTQVDADSVNGKITIEVTSPGGQAVQIDVLVSGNISDNTVVYYKGGERKNLTFDYNIDSCLEKDAAEYNPDLAYMLVALANSAYHKEGLDFTLLKDADNGTFPNNPLAITESLRNLGFAAENGDVREFNYYSSALDSNYGKDTTAFTLATKKMSDGTTLISIVVRGSYGDMMTFASDWRSDANFTNLGIGLHKGFNNAAKEIIDELNKFINDKSISSNNVKFVITGHSRGAAVANLVAKKLIDSGVSKSNVYDYNFACPDSGRDYSSSWNPNEKYNSIYNINNVRDVVGVIPGALFSSFIVKPLILQVPVFWGKYGRTYFFAENWNTITGTSLRLDNMGQQHDATLYLENMKKRQSIDSFKSWEQARITLAANTKETIEKIGKIFGVFCPVDFEIIDKDGVKIAEVVNGQPQYYLESCGDVIIITAGDQSLVYINGKNDYFLKITGYDTGEMTYCVSDAILGAEYGKEITYTNVSLSPGKTMISILDNDEQSDKVTLVLLDEEFNPVKQIDCSGTEQELSNELKEEYSDLPLEKTVTQYKITYNLDGGQVTGNPSTYTKATAAFTLKNPVKSGYAFIGWTGSNGNIPEITVTVDRGTTGDLSYIANWRKEEIKLSRTEATLEKGQTLLLDAVITPSEAKDKQLKWSTSNTNVASVENGLVTAVSAGTATITAESRDGSNIKASCVVTVTETATKRMQEFTGTKSYSKTYGDEEFNLDVKLVAGNGDISYTTSDSKVATVSSSGRVAIRGTGTAFITVSAKETNDYKKCDYIVTVTVAKAEQQIVGTAKYEKKNGDKNFQLDVKLTEGGGTITYESSNIAVAQVSNTGQVTLRGIGETTITVTVSETDNYKAAQFKVTVKVAADNSSSAACRHIFQTSVIPAGTKSNGSIVEKCSKCGEEKSRTVIYAVKSVTLSKTSYTYNGKVHKPAVTVKDSKGKVLKNKTDYTILLPKGMKKAGRYTVTVTLKGNYKGTVKKIFDIVPKGTSISQVTAKKKGFTVNWKKQVSQTTGYEIAYSTSRKFAKKDTKTATVKKIKTTTKSVAKLKATKKYYVRIRTYKTVKVNGKSVKLYSKWSKAKAVTTKK